MKIFKNTILAIVFLGSLTAFSINGMNSKTENAEKTSLIREVPCTTVYTVCDEAFPENHTLFIACMKGNDC